MEQGHPWPNHGSRPWWRLMRSVLTYEQIALICRKTKKKKIYTQIQICSLWRRHRSSLQPTFILSYNFFTLPVCSNPKRKKIHIFMTEKNKQKFYWNLCILSENCFCKFYLEIDTNRKTQESKQKLKKQEQEIKKYWSKARIIILLLSHFFPVNFFSPKFRP